MYVFFDYTHKKVFILITDCEKLPKIFSHAFVSKSVT